jgi:rhamnosyltransferase
LSEDLTNFSVIIPTYQAERFIPRLLPSIFQQSFLPKKILIIDSSSTDKTIEKIHEYSRDFEDLIQIKTIPKAEFNHGKTRDLGTQLVPADFYILLTQDAILANTDAFKNLMACYQNPKIGCAYGRQLPHQNATLLATHARLFNYPETSLVKCYEDRSKLGVKTYFNSDSFSSYRATAYQDVGGFPNHTILSEDAYLAAKMLISPRHWEIAYCAEACAYHSHNYSPLEEFKRYFDIGVFHASEPWLLENFASPNKEGRKYVLSELNFCIKQKGWKDFCLSITSIGMKFLGYQLGKNFKKLPRNLCKKLSMHKGFWKV